jgi:hypothetical protein
LLLFLEKEEKTNQGTFSEGLKFSFDRLPYESVMFFLKKEPKTLALRGFNYEKCFILFKKGTKNISSARPRL